MRFRNLIPIAANLRIFKAFILPQVTCCHIVWHHCRSSDERKIERLQERASWAIYCGRTRTYEALLDKARLPTLSNRRLQDMAMLIYKVRANLVPSYTSDLFNCNRRYNLTNADDFSLRRCNIVTYGRHSLRYVGPFLWLKLHNSFKLAGSSGCSTCQTLNRNANVRIAIYVDICFCRFVNSVFVFFRFSFLYCTYIRL